MKLSSNVSSNTEKQEEKSDGKTQYVEMNENATIPLNFNDDSSRNLTNDATVSFMDLYPFYPIRRIILKNLDFGSQYNLSLIWKDMADEFWCNVDVGKRWRSINNLEDLEYAGVLASAGYITHVDVLSLYHVDVSSIPVNIINSLAKIVDNQIRLISVKGWKTSMLNDANCVYLTIMGMKLDSAADKRPFKVLDMVDLENVTGDLQGLMESLTYGPVDRISRRRLVMRKLDISKVPGILLHSFLKTFKFGIYLETLTGISSQLFSGINCKHLRFQDIEFCEDPEDIGQDINLDIENLHLNEVSGNLFGFFENIKHCSKLHLERIESSLLTNINMTEIIKEKVESLHLYRSPMPDWLKQYDGDGKCVLVEISFYNDDESYESWARARDWTVEIHNIFKRFSRQATGKPAPANPMAKRAAKKKPAKKSKK